MWGAILSPTSCPPNLRAHVCRSLLCMCVCVSFCIVVFGLPFGLGVFFSLRTTRTRIRNAARSFIRSIQFQFIHPSTRCCSKKRKFVADGVFYAELNELFSKELGKQGYAGVEVRVTPVRTEIIIRATNTQEVLGKNYKRIQELTSIIQKRFGFEKEQLTLFAEAVDKRGLCADAQAESLKHKLIEGLAVRRAAYSVVRFIMEAGAKGCEVIVSGKLRAQRAKGMKFKEGYMIKTGDVSTVYVQKAVRHVLMRQGVLGIKVLIMLPHDPTGKNGPKQQLADIIEIKEEKKN